MKECLLYIFMLLRQTGSLASRTPKKRGAPNIAVLVTKLSLLLCEQEKKNWPRRVSLLFAHSVARHLSRRAFPLSEAILQPVKFGHSLHQTTFLLAQTVSVFLHTFFTYFRSFFHYGN